MVNKENQDTTETAAVADPVQPVEGAGFVTPLKQKKGDGEEKEEEQKEDDEAPSLRSISILRLLPPCGHFEATKKKKN